MRHIIAICALLLTSSCVTYTAIESTDVQSLAFAVTQPVADDLDVAARFAPVIISDAPFSSYNRVGAATAAYDHRGNERIYINTAHPVMLLEAGTHRIRDIQIKSFSQLSQSFDLMATEIEGIDALKRLPLGESTTSFFALQGERQGYVKGTFSRYECHRNLKLSHLTFDALKILYASN